MIELRKVSKRFGEETAVDAISFTVEAGALCALVGTSGCGKSTTLRMINRLLEHDGGEIRIDGRPVREFDAQVLRRRIGYVIQSTGLFPHWTVARNIGLVPRLLKWPGGRIQARVEELMALLGLPVEQFADKYPDQLSGGQAQRVGVARALAADPDILLMDEPFGALDPLTRETLQTELREVQARLHKTIVFVTHDMDEALALADHLVVMRDGGIVRQGPPLKVLRDPGDEFVASLLGGKYRGLKEAAILRVAERMVPPSREPPRVQVHHDATLRQALAVMFREHADRLAAVDDAGNVVGELPLDRLVRGDSDG